MWIAKVTAALQFPIRQEQYTKKQTTPLMLQSNCQHNVKYYTKSRCWMFKETLLEH